jgi:hypothetical protein
MKKISITLSACLIALSSSLAFAQQSPPGPPGGGPGGPGMHGPRDCSKAPDAEKKARCEARQAAMKAAQEKCKDAKDEAHRKCMMEALPRPEGMPPKKDK